MPIDPQHFLRCASDSFMQVRRPDGRLLGCIPRPPANTEFVGNEATGMLPIMIGAINMVMVPDGVDPNKLSDFIPIDEGAASLATPP